MTTRYPRLSISPTCRRIHRYLFQDVYAWAGELRVCELVRPDRDPNRPGHRFVPPEQIESLAAVTFGHLGHPATWPRSDTAAVVARLAALYSAVNVLHPFFEGNGRTNRYFVGQAARAAGHRIAWAGLAGRQNSLLAEAFTAGSEPVRRAFLHCVVAAAPMVPQRPAAVRTRPGHLDRRNPRREKGPGIAQ